MQNHGAGKLSFEENYRYAYNMVLHKKEEMLYNGVADLVAKHLDALADEFIVPRFPGGSMDDAVQRTQAGELLLQSLRKVWDDHESTMIKIGQLLKYMVRVVLDGLTEHIWTEVAIQDRIYPEKANLPTTWGKGLELFLKHIIRSPINDHVVATILELVKYEREGYPINRSSVKACVDVFHGLQTDQGTVYKRDVEQQFLKESQAFYEAEAHNLLSTCECPEYLRRVSASWKLCRSFLTSFRWRVASRQKTRACITTYQPRPRQL